MGKKKKKKGNMVKSPEEQHCCTHVTKQMLTLCLTVETETLVSELKEELQTSAQKLCIGRTWTFQLDNEIKTKQKNDPKKQS